MLSAVADIVVSVILRILTVVLFLIAFSLLTTFTSVLWVLAFFAYSASQSPFAPYVVFATGPLSYGQVGMEYGYVRIPMDFLILIYTIYMVGCLSESVAQTAFTNEKIKDENTGEEKTILKFRPVRLDYSVLIEILRDAVGATVLFVVAILGMELIIAVYNALIRPVAEVLVAWVSPDQLGILSIYSKIGGFGTALGVVSALDNDTYAVYSLVAVLLGLINGIVLFIAAVVFFITPLVSVAAVTIAVATMIAQFNFHIASGLASAVAWLERWCWRIVFIGIFSSIVLFICKPFIIGPYSAVWAMAKAVASANMGFATAQARELDAAMTQLSGRVSELQPPSPCSLSPSDNNSCLNALGSRNVAGLILTFVSFVFSIAIGYVLGGSISVVGTSREFVIQTAGGPTTSRLRRYGVMVFNSQAFAEHRTRKPAKT